MTIDVSAKELIESGAHYGHQTKRWNPKMKPYLHGSQDGVHIFDLIQTKKLFEEALNVLSEAKKQGKKILLVGTKKQVKGKIKEVALDTGVYYINERWLGGIITNNKQIQKSSAKLNDMREKLTSGFYKDRTKKERLLIEREITRLERFFGGIKDMNGVPELLFIVDVKKEVGAIKEAQAKGVETVAIVDSNCDPDVVDYPIPMNDDAARALEYAMELVRKALQVKEKSTKSIKSGKTSKK